MNLTYSNRLCFGMIRTLCPKNGANFIFVVSSVSLILIFFSPLQSEIINVHIWNKPNLPPHLTVLLQYHVKYEHVRFCKNVHCSTFSRNEKDVTVAWIGFC